MRGRENRDRNNMKRREGGAVGVRALLKLCFVSSPSRSVSASLFENLKKVLLAPPSG